MSNDDILSSQQEKLIEFADQQATGHVDIRKMYQSKSKEFLIRQIARLGNTLGGKLMELKEKDNEVALWRAFATAAADRAGGVLHIPIEQLRDLSEEVEERATKGCTVETHDDGSVTLTVRSRVAEG